MSSVQSLSGKTLKSIIARADLLFEDAANYLPKKGKTVSVTNDKGETGYIVDKKLVLIEKQDALIPSLKIARELKLKVPKIVVDTGAIKFVTNGADIMRPGIVEIEDTVQEGGLVVVVEERNEAPLCFGRALYDAVDMKSKDKGKCIANLHYLSDEWWDYTF